MSDDRRPEGGVSGPDEGREDPGRPAANDPVGQEPADAAGTAGPDAAQREATGASSAAPDGPPDATPDIAAGPIPSAGRRRRDPLAAALIGLLTLVLGFALAVQVRSAGTVENLAAGREQDLVRILDDLSTSEERLRARIAEQRAALEQLTSSDSRSAAALAEAQERAQAIGILNGTVAATGPGLIMTIRDPADEVRVADLLDAIQELRGAGAETMQIDDVRVGVSTPVTGEPGALLVDGRPISSPYEFVVIGDPQNLEPALNIPGGVVQRIANRGGSVEITRSDEVTVDALRPLDEPQYASPQTDG